MIENLKRFGKMGLCHLGIVGDLAPSPNDLEISVMNQLVPAKFWMYYMVGKCRNPISCTREDHKPFATYKVDWISLKSEEISQYKYRKFQLGLSKYFSIIMLVP